MKTLLVPVDLSPVTAAVLDAATTIARACGSKVYLLHVAPAFVHDLKTIKVPQHERDMLAGKLREEHRAVQELAEDLSRRGVETEALMVEGKGIVGKILDEAKRLGADLIVAGSHGHGRVYDMLVGSTTEGMLRKARIPVMIVPAGGGNS